MGQTIFTTKKMKLESKSWIQKTLIGTVIVAILGAGGFGAYMLVGEDESASAINSRSKHQGSAQSRTASKPLLPAYAKQSDPFAALGGSKGKSSSQSSKQNVSAGKSAKSKKVASHKAKKTKKHLSKTKSSKHKLAAHKKHGKKHLTHQKHSKKKKTAHKKHKSSHKIAQR